MRRGLLVCLTWMRHRTRAPVAAATRFRVYASWRDRCVAAKTQLAALRSIIRRYRDEQEEIALVADVGPAHDEDEVSASPDADVEDEVGEETHADDEPLVDEPLDDADLALLEQIDERIRAVEDTERADDDGDDLDEDAAPERSAKAMTPSRPRDLN